MECSAPLLHCATSQDCGRGYCWLACVVNSGEDSMARTDACAKLTNADGWFCMCMCVNNILQHPDLRPNSATSAHRLDMLRDIASGMVFLHSRKPPIVHGDLRSPNLVGVAGCWSRAVLWLPPAA